MTIHILQVLTDGKWVIVGVFDTHDKAEFQAVSAGYTNWSISEWGIQ